MILMGSNGDNETIDLHTLKSSFKHLRATSNVPMHLSLCTLQGEAWQMVHPILFSLIECPILCWVFKKSFQGGIVCFEAFVIQSIG